MVRIVDIPRNHLLVKAIVSLELIFLEQLLYGIPSSPNLQQERFPLNLTGSLPLPPPFVCVCSCICVVCFSRASHFIFCSNDGDLLFCDVGSPAQIRKCFPWCCCCHYSPDWEGLGLVCSILCSGQFAYNGLDSLVYLGQSSVSLLWS